MDKVCKHEYTHNPQSHSETQSFQFLNKSHNLQIKSLAEQREQHDSSKKKKKKESNELPQRKALIFSSLPKLLLIFLFL